MAHPDPTADPGGGRSKRYRLTGGQVFFAVLTLVLCGYSVLAFDLAWGTEAGRIGPGFFPRLIGVIGTILALVSLIRHVMRPTAHTAGHEAADENDGEPSRHPFLMAVIAFALALFVSFFIPVGAPVTAIAFLLLLFFLIDRRHYLRRVVLSLVFPVFLYFLFDVWLGAGLPEGITFFL